MNVQCEKEEEEGDVDPGWWYSLKWKRRWELCCNVSAEKIKGKWKELLNCHGRDIKRRGRGKNRATYRQVGYFCRILFLLKK